jgi:hypothetical protein
VPTTDELATATGEQLYQLVSMLGITYAVPVGYFDEKGRHHPPKFTASSDRPLVADAPMIGPMGIRPAVHVGGTQNVLNEAGSVNPYQVGILPGEDERVRDLHLNDQGIPAAGTSPDDHFLAPPMFGPDGPIAPGMQKSIRLRLQFFIPSVRTSDAP